MVFDHADRKLPSIRMNSHLASPQVRAILSAMGFTKKQRRDQRKHQFAPKTKTKIPKKERVESPEQTSTTDQPATEETKS
jgi:hypothetical protein